MVAECSGLFTFTSPDETRFRSGINTRACASVAAHTRSGGRGRSGDTPATHQRRFSPRPRKIIDAGRSRVKTAAGGHVQERSLRREISSQGFRHPTCRHFLPSPSLFSSVLRDSFTPRVCVKANPLGLPARKNARQSKIPRGCIGVIGGRFSSGYARIRQGLRYRELISLAAR